MFLLVLIVIAMIARLQFRNCRPRIPERDRIGLGTNGQRTQPYRPARRSAIYDGSDGSDQSGRERHHKKDIRAAIGTRMGDVKPLGQWDQTLELKA